MVKFIWSKRYQIQWWQTHMSLIDKLRNWHENISICTNKHQYISIFSIWNKLIILYYKFSAYFYLLKQQNTMWNKENQQSKSETGWSYHWQEWNFNPRIWSNCSRSEFHNNTCHNYKWRKENWNKYNNIHLMKISSIEINQTGLINWCKKTSQQYDQCKRHFNNTQYDDQ